MGEQKYDLVRTLRDKSHPERVVRFLTPGDVLDFDQAVACASAEDGVFDKIGTPLPSEFMYGDDAPEDADVYLAGVEIVIADSVACDQSGVVESVLA